MTENKVTVPTEQMDEMCLRGERIIDIARLATECLARIVLGTSKDPRRDALHTLRGCGIVMSEEKVK